MNIINQKTFFFVALSNLCLIGCNQVEPRENSQALDTDSQFQAISLKGDSLYGVSSESMIRRFDSVKEMYMKDTMNVENTIWYGRFTAYRKSYKDAIDIYSRAIEKFPADPRLYRHRGHRYISIREFDLAITDLAFAVSLIEGKDNEIEPDGMPNARNTPVSTLHGNIWYHLGLAYYLKQNWEKAHDAYTNCLQSSSNNDNIVSSVHWLYMINQRQGDTEMADRVLEEIYEDMDIIENHSYYHLCLFYKGLITKDELVDEQAPPASQAAILYGLGNWYFYNDEPEKAKEIFETILAGDNWDSFGFIAAEADYVNHFF